MENSEGASPLHQALRRLGGVDEKEAALRQAAWVARCVGRGHVAPLGPGDVSALADFLSARAFEPGQRLYGPGDEAQVWILQDGRVELALDGTARRSVVQVLHPGDVDGDIQHMLGMPFPYTARAVEEGTALVLDAEAFERLLVSHPAISRRWLSSIAQRLATSQDRVIGLLGRTLTAQVARVLVDEAEGEEVQLPQRTLAAMIGVRRPSLNKILRDFEREGMVSLGYGRISLRDVEALGAVAG